MYRNLVADRRNAISAREGQLILEACAAFTVTVKSSRVLVDIMVTIAILYLRNLVMYSFELSWLSAANQVGKAIREAGFNVSDRANETIRRIRGIVGPVVETAVGMAQRDRRTHLAQAEVDFDWLKENIDKLFQQHGVTENAQPHQGLLRLYASTDFRKLMDEHGVPSDHRLGLQFVILKGGGPSEIQDWVNQCAKLKEIWPELPTKYRVRHVHNNFCDRAGRVWVSMGMGSHELPSAAGLNL
jgi:hypothetical protein